MSDNITIIDVASEFNSKNTQYQMGGNGTTWSDGKQIFDCSHWVQYVEESLGVTSTYMSTQSAVNFNTKELTSVGSTYLTEVDISDVRPGDRVYFGPGDGVNVGHVGFVTDYDPATGVGHFLNMGSRGVVETAFTTKGLTEAAKEAGAFYYGVKRPVGLFAEVDDGDAKGAYGPPSETSPIVLPNEDEPVNLNLGLPEVSANNPNLPGALAELVIPISSTWLADLDPNSSAYATALDRANERNSLVQEWTDKLSGLEGNVQVTKNSDTGTVSVFAGNGLVSIDKDGSGFKSIQIDLQTSQSTTFGAGGTITQTATYTDNEDGSWDSKSYDATGTITYEEAVRANGSYTDSFYTAGVITRQEGIDDNDGEFTKQKRTIGVSSSQFTK